MDGLLIDSEPCWRTAERKVFERVGLYLSDADCIQTAGLRLDEVVQYWYARNPWTSRTKQQVEEDVLREMEYQIVHHVRAMPGVKEAVAFFASHKIKMAIASSSPLLLIQAAIQKLQLSPLLDCVHSAQFEAHGKPHPAVFQTTAQKLRVPPSQCLVIEDSINGVIAAKAAGMLCAAVPMPEQSSDARLAIADWRFSSLQQLIESDSIKKLVEG